MAGMVGVTGADGFIGSHLVERLVADGHRVRALAQYNSLGSWGWLDSLGRDVLANVEVISGDVRDPACAREVVEGAEVVYHLAALIAIPYSYRAPRSYVDTNVIGTLNVLDAVRAEGTPRLVHTSTSETYGTARTVPIAETHPQQTQSPYAASKLAADKLVESYHDSFAVPAVTLRPFNTFGPRQSARAVIPTVISQRAAGADEIRLGALTPTRDFTFVSDTARAFEAMAECDAAVGRVVNAGSGFEISIGDTARAIIELMGREVEIVADDQRLRPEASEVERLWADAGLMRSLTGWEPAYGGGEGFRRGLGETIDWFSDRANFARYKTDRYVL